MRETIFEIRFGVDGAAFEPEPAVEIARILRDVAERFESGDATDLGIRDANGNSIGRVWIGPDLS